MDFITTTDRSPSHLNQLLADAADTLVRNHALACAELTERQLAEVIRQALASGDFIRYVINDTGHADSRQQVIYTPGMGNDELRHANDALRDRVALLTTLLETNGVRVPAVDEPTTL